MQKVNQQTAQSLNNNNESKDTQQQMAIKKSLQLTGAVGCHAGTDTRPCSSALPPIHLREPVLARQLRFSFAYAMQRAHVPARAPECHVSTLEWPALPLALFHVLLRSTRRRPLSLAITCENKA